VLSIEALEPILSLVGHFELPAAPHHIRDLAGNPVIITGT
jgi:hypothetical protein